MTVVNKSAHMTRIGAAMDRNYIVCRNGQYFCTQDQKNEIKKIDQTYGTCTGCTVTVVKKSAHITRVRAAMDRKYIEW